MDKEIVKKIETLDKDYEQIKRKFDNDMNEVIQKKRKFLRSLEELALNVESVIKREGENNNLRQVYNTIEKAQDEGMQVIKKAQKKLENERDEQEYIYRKQKRDYEDEMLLKERDN